MKIKLRRLSEAHMRRWDARVWRSYELAPAPKTTLRKIISRKVNQDEAKKRRRAEVPRHQEIFTVPHRTADGKPSRVKSSYSAPDQRV